MYFDRATVFSAFDRFMRHKPNFQPDPPEAVAVQWALDQHQLETMKRGSKKMIFRGKAHQKLFEREIKLHPSPTNRFTAAIYLLTADNELWNQTKDLVSTHDIDAQHMKVHGLSEQGYVFYCAVKDLLTDSRILNVQDLSDRTVIPATAFLVLFTAIAIRGYGMETARRLRLAL